LEEKLVQNILAAVWFSGLLLLLSCFGAELVLVIFVSYAALMNILVFSY